MPRPKGSKNKRKPVAEEELADRLQKKRLSRAALAQEQEKLLRQAAEDSAKLKAVKAQLRKLDRELEALEQQRSEAEAAERAEEARRSVQERIDDLLSQGRSLDDILGLLRQV